MIENESDLEPLGIEALKIKSYFYIIPFIKEEYGK